MICEHRRYKNDKDAFSLVRNSSKRRSREQHYFGGEQTPECALAALQPQLLLSKLLRANEILFFARTRTLRNPCSLRKVCFNYISPLIRIISLCVTCTKRSVAKINDFAFITLRRCYQTLHASPNYDLD